jgi:hypothetical protein
MVLCRKKILGCKPGNFHLSKLRFGNFDVEGEDLPLLQLFLLRVY